MDWLSSLLDNLTYPVICLLMAVESSFIPFPSEVVVPPAAYHAAGGEQNVLLIVVAATIGACIGATVNYLLAYFLGRPIVYGFAESRVGRLCLLSRKKIEVAEDYFNEHGMVATITGRLVPAVRQLISIPAGLAKMNYWKFLVYTAIGAGAWNSILAALGWYLHSIVPEDQLAEKISEYSEYIKLIILALVAVAILYFALKYYIKKRNKEKQ